MGCIYATLNELVRFSGLQFFGSMVRLFGPTLLDQLNTPPIDDNQLVALFTKNDECRPTGMGLESKCDFHQQTAI
jgi:hypothetical protein